MRKMLVSAVTLLLLAGNSAAQEIPFDKPLAWVSSVYVTVNLSFDEVTCRPDGDRLRTEIELALRRSGINVNTLEEHEASVERAIDIRRSEGTESLEFALAWRDRSHLLAVDLTGIHVANRCAIAAEYNLTRAEAITYYAPNALISEYYTRTHVWSGPPSAVQESMSDIIDRHTTDMANEILKELQAWPDHRR